MKKFIITITIFFAITIVAIIGILLLPPTSSSSGNLLYGSLLKDSLLANTPEKRIIFIGGSNLSFGLDSQMIKDSLNLNPINMGIHAGLGLKYMLQEAQPYIKENDIVVIVPEYHQFFGDQVYGREELFRMALDIDRNIFKTFNLNQWIMALKNVLPFVGEKVYFRNYKQIQKNKDAVNYYSIEGFNKYGDVQAHWSIKDYFKANPMPKIDEPYNPKVIEYIESFISSIPKETQVYISFPGFQDKSFDNSVVEINEVYSILKGSNIKLLGNPTQYKFDNSYIFDTPYHLVKEGAEFRTKLLIENLTENHVSNK